ncbi:MAG: 50S ribosomal protein L4 [Magnetococcales bacterium]|nr:50S ribosomal protein L4 [Magnetococcales bacterium]
MIQIPVCDVTNKELRNIELSETVFGRPVRGDLLSMTVNWQLASRRSGTAQTKGRSDVSGGGKKPYKQKGTGRARQGSTRSPQFRHGGVVFGPHPRSYEFKLNKKFRRLALQTALSAKREYGEMLVIDAFGLEAIKTKSMVQILSALNSLHSALIVLAESDQNVEKSVRNLPHISVVRVEGVNVYDLLAHGKVIFTESALKKVEERLA